MGKVVIFEGQDNCFKTTQTKMLLTHFANNLEPTHMIHYSNISNITNKISEKYSIKLYNNMFFLINSINNINCNIIFDRSHIGEAVYSPLYRNYNGNFIFNIEKNFINYNWWNNIYLFLLEDNLYDIIKREDGNSFATDLINKKQEKTLFNKAFNKSYIKNKFIINVNNKDRKLIHKEIVSKL